MKQKNQYPNDQILEPDYNLFTVLVLDNNYLNLFFTKRVLKRKGFNVIDAVSISKAINKIKDVKVDILITEVLLRKSNSFKFTEAIRNNEIREIKSDIIIIGYSSKPKNNIIYNCLDAGMDMFFYKPFDFGIFKDYISKQIKSDTQMTHS